MGGVRPNAVACALVSALSVISRSHPVRRGVSERGVCTCDMDRALDTMIASVHAEYDLDF
jgi:hypothetical protein